MGHLRALVEIGPRVMASEGAVAARAYVRAQLEAQGLVVEEQSDEIRQPDGDPLPVVNLGARIEGSDDAAFGELVLASPLDTAPTETFELLGANEGASGAALLLELAEVLGNEPLPYAVRILFLDGEVFVEGRTFGAELAARSLLEGDVRLLVYLHQVGDADLEIHRDLLSHRVFRESFFRTAERIGHGASFPSAGAFDQVPGGHRVLFRSGLRQIVALSDIRYGGGEPPGELWRTAEDDLDHVSVASLGIVGEVVLEGLRDVALHLGRVDPHVRRKPRADPEELVDLPDPGEASEPMNKEGADLLAVDPSGEVAESESPGE